MNVRNGWHMLHLAHLPATRSVNNNNNNRRDGPEIYYVRGGSIFGKATKVAISKKGWLASNGTAHDSLPITSATPTPMR